MNLYKKKSVCFKLPYMVLAIFLSVSLILLSPVGTNKAEAYEEHTDQIKPREYLPAEVINDNIIMKGKNGNPDISCSLIGYHGVRFDGWFDGIGTAYSYIKLVPNDNNETFSADKCDCISQKIDLPLLDENSSMKLTDNLCDASEKINNELNDLSINESDKLSKFGIDANKLNSNITRFLYDSTNNSDIDGIHFSNDLCSLVLPVSTITFGLTMLSIAEIISMLVKEGMAVMLEEGTIWLFSLCCIALAYICFFAVDAGTIYYCLRHDSIQKHNLSKLGFYDKGGILNYGGCKQADNGIHVTWAHNGQELGTKKCNWISSDESVEFDDVNASCDSIVFYTDRGLYKSDWNDNGAINYDSEYKERLAHGDQPWWLLNHVIISPVEKCCNKISNSEKQVIPRYWYKDNCGRILDFIQQMFSSYTPEDSKVNKFKDEPLYQDEIKIFIAAKEFFKQDVNTSDIKEYNDLNNVIQLIDKEDYEEVKKILDQYAI